MLKHLMNGGSLLSYALYDGNDDDGTPDPKEVLRQQLAKGNLPAGEVVPAAEGGEGDEEDEESDAEDESDEEDEEDEEADPPAEETEDQKKEREAKEKIEAKAKRKDERIQRRIDDAVARAKRSEAELAAFKAANPDIKLTEAEVNAKAEALADQKLAKKQLEDLQAAFDGKCEDLQKAATKINPKFYDIISELAEDIGPIPSFMIGVLHDMDNGGEVLEHVAKDDELAEKIWKANPAKQTRMLVDISTKLAEDKKIKPKKISRVPDPGTPVKTNRVLSNVITEADTKNMDQYVAKRQRQMLEKRKLQGYS